MTLDEALAIILGPEIADATTMDQGQHWAVVAAMARATTDQNPEAIATIRRHVAERKKRESRVRCPRGISDCDCGAAYCRARR